jgi:hypothetical protein
MSVVYSYITKHVQEAAMLQAGGGEVPGLNLCHHTGYLNCRQILGQYIFQATTTPIQITSSL